MLPPKRHQGLSTGQYLLLAAINRAVSPTSKLQFADWYQQTAMRFQLLRQELGAVVDIASVNLVEQRDVEIGADQQAKADLAMRFQLLRRQIIAFLLIMTALRKFSGSEGIDVGEEKCAFNSCAVGAVIDQGAEIDLEPLDVALGD